MVKEKVHGRILELCAVIPVLKQINIVEEIDTTGNELLKPCKTS
jgi:hypothetical protein